MGKFIAYRIIGNSFSNSVVKVKIKPFYVFGRFYFNLLNRPKSIVCVSVEPWPSIRSKK